MGEPLRRSEWRRRRIEPTAAVPPAVPATLEDSGELMRDESDEEEDAAADRPQRRRVAEAPKDPKLHSARSSTAHATSDHASVLLVCWREGGRGAIRVLYKVRLEVLGAVRRPGLDPGAIRVRSRCDPGAVQCAHRPKEGF